MGTDGASRKHRRVAPRYLHGAAAAEWRGRAIALLLAASGCQAVASRQPPLPVASNADPLASRLGWLQGPCLAIRNPDLKIGTPVVVVLLSTPQVVRTVPLGSRTHSATACPALADVRAAVNDSPETSFYSLTDAIEPSDVGIGIIGPRATPEVTEGFARSDLDADGSSEVFASCSTSEGLQFQVWTVKGAQRELRWSAYEYLAYDVEATCP